MFFLHAKFFMTNLIFLSNLLYYSYKHALDGLMQVARHEGPMKLMSGVTMASSRATFVTIGQVRHRWP